MKSKTVKLIFTALAFCLLISILAMGALATGNDSAEPTNSDTSSTPEPEKVTVSFTVEGYQHMNGVRVTVDGDLHTGSLGSNGSYSVSVEKGANVVITVTPEDGYKVNTPTASGWTVSEGTASIENIQSAATVSFKIEAKVYHDISATISPEAMESKASISVSPARAYQGQPVTVTVWLDGGYKVDQISAGSAPDGIRITETSGSTATVKYYTFTMPDYDVSVNATIAVAKYELEVNYGNHGTVTYTQPDEGDTYSYGEYVDVRIKPDSGYYVSSFTVNGQTVGISSNYYSFRIYEDTKIVVTFTDRLTVTTGVNNGRYGSVSVYDYSGYDGYFIPGETVYIECEPEDGYNVKDVTVTDTVTGNTLSVSQSSTDKNIYYFTMPEHPVKVYVEFQEGYAIKVADTKYGKVKVSAENADEDDVITITTEPDKGYAVSKISIKTDGGETVTYRTSIATKNSYYFYMPDDNVTITVTFGVAHKDMPFTDVHSYSWFYDAVQFVYDNDIMNGVSDTSFNPDGTVTRGMIVTMLWRMAGEPYSFGGGFSDVPAGHYSYSAAAWASRNGIVNGMTSTTFAPDTNITREQLVTILYRYAQYLGYSTTGSSLYGFTDASSVSSYATNAMSWAVKYGIISGVTTTTLVPAGTATRAQAAQMFMSFYDFLD